MASEIMFPRIVNCEDCGQVASVRGYGRIQYDWPETTNSGHEATIPTIKCVRLTIDCPRCGVTSQEYFPEVPSPAPQRPKVISTTSGDATRRSLEVRFQRLGPTNRPRS
jgi:hypothetical protein